MENNIKECPVCFRKDGLHEKLTDEYHEDESFWCQKCDLSAPPHVIEYIEKIFDLLDVVEI